MTAADMRHAHLLDGLWVYSRVTLSCGCSMTVANPMRAVTTHDDFWCETHQRMVKPVSIQPATLTERDALCQPAIEATA